MLLTENEAREVCDKLLKRVQADDAVVGVSSNTLSHLRFAANRFTTSGRQEQVTVSVTVWKNQKRGASTASNLDEASLAQAVSQAEELARLSPVDHEYVPTLGPQQYKPTGGYVEATVEPSLTARAKSIDEIIGSCEKQNVIGAWFHHTNGTAAASATKNGNFTFHRSTLAALSVTARTPDGTSSGYFLRNHFDIAKLDPARIGREAIKKALDAREAKVLEPGTYPVILEPQAAGDLLQFDFNARSADEGRSPWSAPGGKTRQGQKLFDERLSLVSDPLNPDLPGSPAAQDGIPAERLYFIKNGALETLDYSRFWAKKQDKAPTPGPVNYIFENSGKAASLEEMIQATQRGLLVTRFFYIRMVDPRTALFTGLTRDGVWLIEGGKIKHAVRNFRFNQSLLALLAPGNVEMIGHPERISSSEGQGNGALLVPALKVKQFNFTSASDAV